jgi:hypothetical protein
MKIKWIESRILWGGLLILAGVVFLLQNLGVLRAGDLFWAGVLLLGGIFFVSWFLQDRRGSWWALIPGFALLSMAGSILMTFFNSSLPDEWGGAVILGGIGISFMLVYALGRERWWALIPGGVLLTLSGMILMEAYFPERATVGVFLLGMGLTFGLVAVLPNLVGEMRWAWIPAGILLAMGLLFIAAAGEALAYFWAGTLILVGGLMIYRALKK